MGKYWLLASCQANVLQKTREVALTREVAFLPANDNSCSSAFFFFQEGKCTPEVGGNPVFKEQEGASPLKANAHQVIMASFE